MARRALNAIAWLIAWGLIAWGMLNVTGLAHAGEYHAAQLHGLYTLAVGRAGLGVPEKPPAVYRVSPRVLQAIVCRAPCAIRAAQVEEAVFYSAELNPLDPRDNAILVHEFVHYLQWVRYGPATDCLARLERERHAYQVQAEILEQAGIAFARPELTGCT